MVQRGGQRQQYLWARCVFGWVGGWRRVEKGGRGKEGGGDRGEDGRGGVGGVGQKVHNELNCYISSLSQNNFIVVNITIIVSKGLDTKYSTPFT